MKPTRAPSLVLACALLAACTPSETPSSATPPAATGAPAAGLDISGMDRSVKPGDDFFRYANGGWLKTHEIPADRASYGPGAMLVELTLSRTSDLIKEAAGAAAGSEARKIGDYYGSLMDEAGIEAKGIAPLKPALDRIATIKDAAGLSRALGATVRADVDVLNNTNTHTDNILGLWVAQDLSDPSRYAPFILQGGLGLPDRDYYLDASPRMTEIRQKYQAHITKMLELAGVASPEAKAARILELERKIAQTHSSAVDAEDVHKGNNHWARADLQKRAPGLDWDAFLGAVGLEKQANFVIWQPGALTGISALVASEPIDVWRDYLTFHAIDRAAPYLPKAFVEQSFAFHGSALAGIPKLADRWKRAVADTSEALGEAVGKLYVARWFPAAEKARVEEMVKNELLAFAKRIDKLDWMSPATKLKAKAKLAALKVGVGYPDKWRDYSGLEVVKGDALGNAERAGLFELHRNVNKLGQPVDRGEWAMTPQLVNAVNLPAMNALNFPAAILQPPFLDPSRPVVMDYGGTGATIGHEISHSFDDQGALFDATGKLSNWWTPDDFAHFKASSTQLAKQYDAYHPFPDLAVNGNLTLSENIADLAGLGVAYDAYRISQGGKEAPAAQGLGGDQQFFLSYAQSWCSKMREPLLRRRVMTDGHAPPEYRADTVRNLDAWYTGFDVKQGDKLFLAPADRVRIW